MQDIQPLLRSLKSALKDANRTYADVAIALGMSESNVKRLFSTGRFSLPQLAAVCEQAGLDFAGLVQRYESSRRRLSRLSLEQEQALVDDTTLLLVAVCVRNHWLVEDIVRVYRLTEVEVIRQLTRLDRLRLLELLPGNRYRLLVAENFQWLPGGPMERWFEARMLGEFLDARFDGEDAIRRYLGGSISAESARTLRRRLADLDLEFAHLHARDARLPASEKVNVGIVLALRPWELAVFRRLRRAEGARESENL